MLTSLTKLIKGDRTALRRSSYFPINHDFTLTLTPRAPPVESSLGEIQAACTQHAHSAERVIIRAAHHIPRPHATHAPGTDRSSARTSSRPLSHRHICGRVLARETPESESPHVIRASQIAGHLNREAGLVYSLDPIARRSPSRNQPCSWQGPGTMESGQNLSGLLGHLGFFAPTPPVECPPSTTRHTRDLQCRWHGVHVSSAPSRIPDWPNARNKTASFPVGLPPPCSCQPRCATPSHKRLTREVCGGFGLLWAAAMLGQRVTPENPPPPWAALDPPLTHTAPEGKGGEGRGGEGKVM